MMSKANKITLLRAKVGVKSTALRKWTAASFGVSPATPGCLLQMWQRANVRIASMKLKAAFTVRNDLKTYVPFQGCVVALNSMIVARLNDPPDACKMRIALKVDLAENAPVGCALSAQIDTCRCDRNRPIALFRKDYCNRPIKIHVLQAAPGN